MFSRIEPCLVLSRQGAKVYSGRIGVYCSQTGALPPGAQGFPGQITYSCSFSVPLPPGVQGFPGSPFLSVEGGVAMAFWEGFNAESTWHTGTRRYQKSYEADSATFKCEQVREDYLCSVTTGGSADVGDTGDSAGGDVAESGSTLDLRGSAATAVYQKMQVQAAADGSKRQVGRLAVYCSQRGALPPGAQGFPGQITYSCSASVPLPRGAQGFPAPAFLTLEGQAASQFWSAFAPEEKWNRTVSWYEKSFESDDASFVCRKDGSSHRCTISDR